MCCMHEDSRYCVPCWDNNVQKKIPNKAVAINHWTGGSTLRAASTLGCHYVRDYPPLLAFARSEKQTQAGKKAEKANTSALQATRDQAAADKDLENSGDEGGIGVQLPKAPLTAHQKSNPSVALGFVATYITKLDRAIANHVIEDATPLVAPQKLAFREMIDAAIELGHNVGKSVYKHPGKKRMRDDIIPYVVGEQQPSKLQEFDLHIKTFGATLVSDGKDDVSKAHPCTCMFI